MIIGSSPTEKPRIWRWEGMALAALFGVGVLLWPFLSFGAIFMFDSPIQSRSDLVGRYTVAFFIWLYPVTYVATCLAYYILRKCGVWRLASCLAWGLPVVAYFILAANLAWRGEPANSKRVQVLYRTDHTALLAACREMMSKRHAYSKQWEHNGGEFVDPKDPAVPAAIVALEPTSIVVSDDDVFMDLHGGFDRYGIAALSEKTATTQTNAVSGDVMLIPGLWFFDEQLSYQSTDCAAYIKTLRALKPDNAPAPKW